MGVPCVRIVPGCEPSPILPAPVLPVKGALRGRTDRQKVAGTGHTDRRKWVTLTLGRR